MISPGYKLSALSVLALAWDEACACGCEVKASVKIGCDVLVCFILSEQPQSCSWSKNQAGSGALRAVIALRVDHLSQIKVGPRQVG